MVKRLIFFVLVLANIGCDQVSKNVVRKTLNYGERIQVVEDHFVLTKIENTGAALGLGEDLSPIGKKVFLNFLPLITLIVLSVFVLRRNGMNNYLAIAFAFIIGGGLGNLIDRFLFGSVTDFLYMKIWVFKTGIFNMAEVSVTLGAIFVLLASLLELPKSTIKSGS